MAADRHELMIPQRIMQPSVARTIDLQCSQHRRNQQKVEKYVNEIIK